MCPRRFDLLTVTHNFSTRRATGTSIVALFMTVWSLPAPLEGTAPYFGVPLLMPMAFRKVGTALAYRNSVR